MQRSSSFSLPACSNGLELPSFSPTGLPFPSAFTGLQASPASPSSSSSSPSPSKPPCPLYLSHEQICLPEPTGPAEACSSSDSTPELGRRGGQGGLARSRSQPCALNEKKIGVKRRRPADTHKQRPSLDLAKMTQKLRNFHSLSCPGITGEDVSPVPPTPSTLASASPCHPSVEPHCSSEGEGHLEGDDDSADDQDADPPGCGYLNSGTTNGKEREPLWAGLCESRRDVYQLGGELDIEQIERN